jgi:hypothetical protein
MSCMKGIFTLFIHKSSYSPLKSLWLFQGHGAI